MNQLKRRKAYCDVSNLSDDEGTVFLLWVESELGYCANCDTWSICYRIGHAF